MNWIQKAEAMITSPHGFSTSKQAIFYKRSGIGETLETNTDWCIKKTLYSRKYIKTSHSFLDINEDYLTETEEIRNPFFVWMHQTARKWSSNNNKLRMNKKYLLSQLGTKRSMLNKGYPVLIFAGMSVPTLGFLFSYYMPLWPKVDHSNRDKITIG